MKRLGYFTAWLFDWRGMPLDLSYGEILVIGGIAIGAIIIIRNI